MSNVRTLQEFLLSICLVTLVGVFSIMLYSIWAYCRSRKGERPGSYTRLSVEIIWAIIPIMIIIALIFPAVKAVWRLG